MRKEDDLTWAFGWRLYLCSRLTHTPAHACMHAHKLWDRLIWQWDTCHAQLHTPMLTLFSCTRTISEMEKLSAQLQMFTKEKESVRLHIFHNPVGYLFGSRGHKLIRCTAHHHKYCRELLPLLWWGISQTLSGFPVKISTEWSFISRNTLI